MSGRVTLEDAAIWLTEICVGRIKKDLEDSDDMTKWEIVPAVPSIRFLAETEYTYLRWCRRALEALGSISKDTGRYDVIKACEGLFDRLIESCTESGEMKPDPSVVLDWSDLKLMKKAVVFVTEFDLRRRMEESEAKRTRNWKGRR